MKILMVSWEYPPVVIGGLGSPANTVQTSGVPRRMSSAALKSASSR